MSLGIVKFKLFLFCLLWSTQSILINGRLLLEERKYLQNYPKCTTPNGELGRCCRMQFCTDLFKIEINPNKTEEEKLLLDNSRCGYSGQHKLVCCPSEIKDDTGVTLAIRSSIKDAVGVKNDNEETSKEKYRKILLPGPGVCGLMTSGHRIAQGKTTSIREFPWMAILIYKNILTNTTFYDCAGSLINERFILTAAHCVVGLFQNTNLTGIRLGEWDLRTDEDCDDFDGKCAPPPVDGDIKKIHIHFDYNITDNDSLYNDIALIELEKPVNYTSFVRPICLPVFEELQKASLFDHILIVSGWGLTENNKPSMVKLKAPTKVTTLNKCNEHYASEDMVFIPSQLCTKDVGGTDSCSGDSGGPLMASRRSGIYQFEHYFLFGIVSFGRKSCGGVGSFSVNTRVTSYLNWILDTIA